MWGTFVVHDIVPVWQLYKKDIWLHAFDAEDKKTIIAAVLWIVFVKERVYQTAARKEDKSG